MTVPKSIPIHVQYANVSPHVTSKLLLQRATQRQERRMRSKSKNPLRNHHTEAADSHECKYEQTVRGDTQNHKGRISCKSETFTKEHHTNKGSRGIYSANTKPEPGRHARAELGHIIKSHIFMRRHHIQGEVLPLGPTCDTAETETFYLQAWNSAVVHSRCVWIDLPACCKCTWSMPYIFACL